MSTIWLKDWVKDHNDAALRSIERDLILLSKQSPLKRSRICFHDDPQNDSQFMLIQLCRGTFIPIHKHTENHEVYFPTCGIANLLLFDEQMILTDRRRLTVENDGCRGLFEVVPRDTWHTIICVSETFRYLEYRRGRMGEGEVKLKSSTPSVEELSYIDSLCIGGRYGE